MNWNDSISAARRLPTIAGAAVNVLTEYVVGNVADLSAITFYFAGTSGRGRVIFQYYADQSQTLLLSSNSFDTQGGEFASWSVPVSGPWLTVIVSPSTAMTFNLQMWSDSIQSFQPSNRNFVAPFILFSGDAVVYPVGTTVLEGFQISPGPATFFGEVATNLSSLTLYAVDMNNNQYIISKHLFANGVNTKPVMLPSMHLRLTVVNLTAGAVNMSYGLVSKYGLL